MKGFCWKYDNQTHVINRLQLQEVVAVIKHRPRTWTQHFRGVNVFSIYSTSGGGRFQRVLSGCTSVWRPTRAFDAARGTFFLQSVESFYSSTQSGGFSKSLSRTPLHAGRFSEKAVWLGNLTSGHYLTLKWLTHTQTLFIPFLFFFLNFLLLLCVTCLTERQWGSDVCNTVTAAGIWRPEALHDDKRWDN